MRFLDLIKRKTREKSRDNADTELGISGPALDARINTTAHTLEENAGKGPLVILGAISLVEGALLDEHFTGRRSTTAQHTVWHTILEVLHLKRVAAIRHDATALLSTEDLDTIRRYIRSRYMDLREEIKQTSPSLMIHQIGLVDRAMADCLTADWQISPARQGLWVREICRLGYEAKVAVLNYKLP